MNRRIFHILNAALAVAFWLFYGLKFSGIMHGIEGDSLFLFTGQFASEILSRSGGISNYLGAFLTQFYYWPLLGSALVALLLAALSEGVAAFCKSEIVLPFALVPSAVCAILLLDPKWTTAMPVALCVSVWVMYAAYRLRPLWLRITAMSALAVLLWFKVLDCQFYTYAEAPTVIYMAVLGGTVTVCVLGALIPRMDIRFFGALAQGIIAAAVCVIAPGQSDPLSEEIAEYEYMVRVRDWDGILSKASADRPSSPLSTNAVNLALEMKGRLGDDIFKYYQSGLRSLANFEERKLSSEVLYLLGFVNEARRVAFEDMAANPSRDRGVYHLTRLVNFNSVDSLYRPVARRYLNTLRHTLFYRDFKPESLVTPDMEPEEDFFFNYSEFSQMLGFLHNQRPGNVRARDYFAASLLLDKRTSLFAAFFSPSDDSPKSWREAFQIAEALGGGKTAPELQAYVDLYNVCHGKPGGMGRYSSTYWYYFNFR